MTVLSEIIAACDPALQAYAVDKPKPGRFEGRFDSRVRAFVFEAVYEAYLMHYRTPRAFAGVDPDLRLLAGDSLYALGVSRLAETGDLEAVAELSRLIAGCASAEAEGRSELIDELWSASLQCLAADSGRADNARAAIDDRSTATP